MYGNFPTTSELMPIIFFLHTHFGPNFGRMCVIHLNLKLQTPGAKDFTDFPQIKKIRRGGPKWGNRVKSEEYYIAFSRGLKIGLPLEDDLCTIFFNLYGRNTDIVSFLSLRSYLFHKYAKNWIADDFKHL